jgi:Zn-dependent peptidase ImmA (M78 family)/transcriptional regulator with XRE-family HTH domain
MEVTALVPTDSPTDRGVPVPARIRLARDLRSLTQGETVAAMKEPITAAGLSQIESGKVRPLGSTLNDLAEALEVPVEFFYAQWGASSPDDRDPAIFFRDLRATPASERRRALALAVLLSDLVAAIEHYVRLPELRVPEYPIPSDARSGDIEVVAERVRRDLELNSAPIRHAVREVERLGVPVARMSMGHRQIDAFSVPLVDRPVILLASDKDNYVRSRLDVAHEAGHLIMHGGRTERDRSMEQQAHSFAASFLFPAHVAVEELPRRLDGNGWARIAELKRRWGMSMAALIRRARDLKLISEDEYRNAMKYMSARGWRKREPGDRELGPAESPLLLERALRRIKVEHNLEPEELIAEAHLPERDTLEMVEATKDPRPIIEL